MYSINTVVCHVHSQYSQYSARGSRDNLSTLDNKHTHLGLAARGISLSVSCFSPWWCLMLHSQHTSTKYEPLNQNIYKVTIYKLKRSPSIHTVVYLLVLGGKYVRGNLLSFYLLWYSTSDLDDCYNHVVCGSIMKNEFELNACLRSPKPYPFLTLIAGLHLRYFLRRSYRSVSFSHSIIDWYWSSFRQKATVSRQTSMLIRGLFGSRIGREDVFRLSLTWALTGDKM